MKHFVVVSQKMTNFVCSLITFLILFYCMKTTTILSNLMAWAAIIVLAMSAQAQKFAILSDVHVTPGNANEQQLRLAVQEINQSDAQAVLMTGDLTNEGSDVQLRNVKSILDGITKPLFVIPGNHENNWSQSACKTFVDLWGDDRFVFEVGDLVVIGMNCGPFMKMGDGHIKQEDFAWLERELKMRVTPGKRVLSINHYPLKDDLDNYAEYYRILNRFPVVAHQNGHYHHWEHYVTGGINGVMVRALDMGKGDYGYSRLEVRGDSTLVWNKRIGHEPELKFAFARNPLSSTIGVDAPAPQRTVNSWITVEQVLQDEASIFTRVAVDKDQLYYGNSLGQVKAVDKKTAKLRWQFATGAMLFSRPAPGGDVVVMPTVGKGLVWLDRRTGTPRYEAAAPGPYVADGVVSHGVLYQGGYKTFQAWDIKRHRLLWHYDSINNYCQAAPVVNGRDVIFGAWDTRLRCLDTKTGALKWQWDNGKNANLYSPGNVVPAVTRDRVIIVAPDRHATALDRRTGRQLWRHHDNDVKVRESLGLSADKQVAYAKTMDGTVVAIDTRSDDYRELWTVDCGFGYEHAPCIVLEHKGYILAGSRRGMLAVLDAATHKLLLTHRLGTSEVNGFDVDAATGDVYCSLIEGSIHRISFK